MVGDTMELGVTDPVAALNAPPGSHQMQQRFRLSAQARQEEVGGLKRLALTAAAGREFHNPAGADPGLPDVLRGWFGPQGPGMSRPWPIS